MYGRMLKKEGLQRSDFKQGRTIMGVKGRRCK